MPAGPTRVPIRHAALFGATGSLGPHLARELLRRGAKVRAVSRTREKLERDFVGLDVDLHPADLSQPAAAVRVAGGCDVVFHTVGLPLSAYEEHVRLARSTAEAMRVTGARGVAASSYWSFGPGGSTSLREDDPPVPGCRVCEIRRRTEDVLLGAGAAVAILPDFYGPMASLSLLNDALDTLRRGEAVRWPGDPDAPREFIFLPDAARHLCDLAERREAEGRRWNVPGGGARAPRSLLEDAAETLGSSARVTALHGWLVAVAGLVRRDAREFREILPLYDAPIGFDSSRLRELLGGLETTPYADGIRTTLDWLGERAAERD
ncbi:MAG: NAD(P)H-binding protein [Candidatus Palauibacterales bacterium]|nr:NAD(P)H-binding protein [Candidatus Palauibacterales bacterium]MDP2530714.1 NAD(P)H-binding protein [Candidatus Palauibacterales bacterium]